MNRKKILALIIVLATVSLLVFSSPISAAKGGHNSSGCADKPGQGLGDKKHEHYGPPGHNDRDERPGWGYGDKNHKHYFYGYHYECGQ